MGNARYSGQGYRALLVVVVLELIVLPPRNFLLFGCSALRGGDSSDTLQVYSARDSGVPSTMHCPAIFYCIAIRTLVHLGSMKDSCMFQSNKRSTRVSAT